MRNELLYLLFGLILVEFSLKSFFETNISNTKSSHMSWKDYIIYRSLAFAFYAMYFMYLGDNFKIFVVFFILISLTDYLYYFIESRYWNSAKTQFRLICGLLWFLALMVITIYISKQSIDVMPSRIKPVVEIIGELFKNVTPQRLFTYLISCLFVLHASNRIVVWVLKDLTKGKELRVSDSKTNQTTKTNNLTDDLERAGRYIGSLERILFLTLLLSDNPILALGTVFAAKTLVRFDLVKQQAEYYLIGTLTSLLIALFLYAFIKFSL